MSSEFSLNSPSAAAQIQNITLMLMFMFMSLILWRQWHH